MSNTAVDVKVGLPNGLSLFIHGRNPALAQALAPMLVEMLGQYLSDEALEAELSQLDEIPQEDLVEIKKRHWYLVKASPQSEEARAIAGQLVTVAQTYADGSISVFTIDVFLNRSGIAIRVPTSDLTNRL